jgi:hypothetical protein
VTLAAPPRGRSVRRRRCRRRRARRTLPQPIRTRTLRRYRAMRATTFGAGEAMAAEATAAPSGPRNAQPPSNTAGAVSATVRPSVAPAGFAASHPVPAGHIRLVCPPGAASAPISHDIVSYEAFREHGPGNGAWLVDVPAEAAYWFLRTGGFRLFVAQ